MPVLGRFEESGANIRFMNSPRSGFHRATAASWALAGLGVAGIAGASSLAYGDTFKPAPEAPVRVATAAAPEVPDLPAAPEVATTPAAPPPVPVAVTTEPSPPPVVADAPVRQYPPKQANEQAPASGTRESHAPAPTTAASTPSTTRHVKPPTIVNSPNYSPHVTISRGS